MYLKTSLNRSAVRKKLRIVELHRHYLKTNANIFSATVSTEKIVCHSANKYTQV